MPEAKDTTKSPTRKTGVVQAGQANIEDSSSAAQGSASAVGAGCAGAAAFSPALIYHGALRWEPFASLFP